jgi:hypothetical protein
LVDRKENPRMSDRLLRHRGWMFLAMFCVVLSLVAGGCKRRHRTRRTGSTFGQVITPPPVTPPVYNTVGLMVPAPIATAPDNGTPIPPPGVMRMFPTST